MDKTTTDIDGDHNIVSARGDIYINTIQTNTENENNKIQFQRMDIRFEKDVQHSRKILRKCDEITFSSEALFTSLMRVGLDYNDALETASSVVTILSCQRATSNLSWIPSTLDVRSAVMRVFNTFSEDNRHKHEQISLWFSTYIRRYGNPDNSFVKVIDHNQYVDLNYHYLKETILPHLISRILGINNLEDSAITGVVRTDMADAILDYTKQLNMYSIRYKTLINLLQDLILEPPHPWFVTPNTIDRVVRYNLERAEKHFGDLSEYIPLHNYEYSARECFQHTCASILANYGAFMGVGHKYGLIELQRILKIKNNNSDLWHFCKISSLQQDLKSIGVDLCMFINKLERSQILLLSPEGTDRRRKLLEHTAELLKLCRLILACKVSEVNIY